MTVALRGPLAIVGSRDFSGLDLVREYVASLPPDVTVISGAARGVDRTAAEAARARGLRVVEYPADWSTGRGAGFARNAIIARECASMLAFWDGRSRGTAHVIAQAVQLGKVVTIVPCRQPTTSEDRGSEAR